MKNTTTLLLAALVLLAGCDKLAPLFSDHTTAPASTRPRLELAHLRTKSGREQLNIFFRSQRADSVLFTVQCVPGVKAKDFELYKYPLKNHTAAAHSWKTCPHMAVVMAQTPYGYWVDALPTGLIRTINNK